MKAVACTRYGPPGVLALTDVATPVPADDQVLVKVRAVSLNASDWEVLRGKPLYSRVGGLFRPRRHILGSGIAGRVEAAGRRVRLFRPSDDVLGDILGSMGGLAEYACVPQAALAVMPAGLTYEEAAAMPQAGAIAWQGIRDKGQLQPGQKVLINGGGGGSGMYAVQLAKLAGAEVTGVDNAQKLEFMRSLGADHVIDYAREDFTRTGRGYDLILDLAAYRPAVACRRSLLPGGRYLYGGGSVATLLQVLLIGPLIGRAGRQRVRLLAVRLGAGHLDPIIWADPGGKDHHGDRSPLSPQRGAAGAALPRRRARQGQGRHHRRIAPGVAAPSPRAPTSLPHTTRAAAPVGGATGARRAAVRRVS